LPTILLVCIGLTVVLFIVATAVFNASQRAKEEREAEERHARIAKALGVRPEELRTPRPWRAP
jgi:ABC-type lipoprotein release transport system permease subunit